MCYLRQFCCITYPGTLSYWEHPLRQMDILDNFSELLPNIVVFESSLTELVKEKRFTVFSSFLGVRVGHQKDPFYLLLRRVQLLSV